MRRARFILSTLAITAALVSGARAQSPALTKVTLAVPSYASYLAFGYVAADQGFWKDLGLDADVTLVSGPGAQQAASVGEVQFAVSSGSDMIQVVARGGKLISIAQLFNRLNYQVILSKKLADKSGLDITNSTPAQRAKVLKGLNIAVSNAGGPSDAFLSHVLRVGGLDPDKDVTRPIIPNSPAQNAALNADRIDGFAGGSPFTTIAVRNGSGVDWVDGVRDDLPNMNPFVYSVIVANPDYCRKNSDICRKFLTGINRAVEFMKTNRDKSIEIVAKNLKTADPALLQDDFDRLLGMMPAGLRMVPKAWANTQDFDLEVGAITPAMKKDSLEGTVYTDAYLP